jgi:hypothetical protein
VAAVLIEAEAIKGHALANRHRTPSLRGAANSKGACVLENAGSAVLVLLEAHM